MSRVVVVVADGLGVGGAEDADRYGTPGADTLGHLAAAVPLDLPVLAAAGAGRLTTAPGLPPLAAPVAVCARLAPASAGNDTPTGHWELMGRPTDTAPLTFPNGFPDELLAQFAAAAGVERVLGNTVENGVAVINRLGGQHLATGWPIVYTSADSVFQVAAHTDVVPLELLYRWCATARGLLQGRHAVGRVIARPFTGPPGAFTRRPERRDWALPPPEPTALDLLTTAGVPVLGVGKIGDIFAHRGLSAETHPGGNTACLAATTAALGELDHGLVFTNLVDFDSRYGHVRDPHGFAAALGELDRWLAATLPTLRAGDRLVLTADHGNDPTYLATNDHTRERVPLLAWGPDLTGRDLGVAAMCRLGPTVCRLLGVRPDGLAGAPLRALLPPRPGAATGR